MHLRTKAPLIVLILSAGIFAAVGEVCYRSQLDYVEVTRQKELGDIAARLKASLSGLKRSASAYAEFVSHMPEVKKAFHARDREALHKALYPSFQLMKKSYGAEAALFETPDLKFFMSLGKPYDPNDPLYKNPIDLSHREMVVRANRAGEDRQTQAGLETSMATVMMRAIAPVEDGDFHCGSFEWTVGFGRTITATKENTGADVALFVDEKAFAAALTSQSAANAAAAAKAAEGDRIADGYRTIEPTSVPVMKQFVNHEFLASLQELRIETRTVGDTELGIVAMPLEDFGERRIGAIVAAKEMSEAQRKVKHMRVVFIAAMSIGLILLAGVVQVVFNGLLVRPIDEVGEKLDLLAKGDTSQKLGDLVARKDEVGGVARSVEKIREQMDKDKVERAKAALGPDLEAKAPKGEAPKGDAPGKAS